MKHKQNDYQQGQALVESVLIMLLLIGLLIAIQSTGRLRSQSLVMLGESSYQTFLLSRDKPSAQHSYTLHTAPLSKLKNTFSQQLLQVHEEGLVQFKHAQGKLHRSSYLFVNEGRSDTAREVQTRVENSKDAWHGVASQTRALLRPVTKSLKQVDLPWGRASLTTDWLNRWVGQTPTSALPRGSR